MAGATVGFIVTIATNPGALFYGSLTNLSTAAITTATVGAGAGSFPVALVAKNGANFVLFNANARSGDYVEMVSDGTYWYVNGVSTTVAGLGLA